MKAKHQDKKRKPSPTHQDLEQAVAEFQKRGGKIKQVGSYWIEEGPAVGYQPK